ncbi:MAG: hypothetical protein U9N85_07840 [Bacteroidota bacterium]|nr:hypothetical protein [Bacteroidota bacterium]
MNKSSTFYFEFLSISAKYTKSVVVSNQLKEIKAAEKKLAKYLDLAIVKPDKKVSKAILDYAKKA